METPKYALFEHERRFLVAPDDCPPLGAGRLIEDLYLRDSRLRLRMITDESTGEREFKLCKTYPWGDPVSAPIVNIYLTEIEHEAFARLPGAWLRKRRHRLADGLCLDRFEGPLQGLLLCEASAGSPEAVQAIAAPSWIRREVTGEAAFTGAALSRTTAEQLAALLAGRGDFPPAT